MRYELKSVAIWPMVKVTFLISLVIGFLLGLFIALLIGPMMAMMSSFGMPDSGLETARFSVGAMMLFLPILYALFMAVFNAIGALIAVGLYNAVARWGGLEFDLGSIGEIRDHHPAERVVYGTAAYPSPPAPPQPAPPPPPSPPPPRPDTPGGDNI